MSVEVLGAVRELSLGATFELACMAALDPQGSVHSLVSRFAQSEEAFASLTKAQNRSVGLFDAPSVEIAAVPVAIDSSSQFHQRFTRSLQKSGFARPLDAVLAKALAEMADNVLQHSGERTPAAGIWGYHVEREWMTFAVADLGRGILASLGSNPRYAHLRRSSEALEQAVRCGASRRVDGMAGMGFSALQRNLASYGGQLRFRSGDAALSLGGESGGYRSTPSSSANLRGFQLVVTVDLRKRPQERPVTHSNR